MHITEKGVPMARQWVVRAYQFREEPTTYNEEPFAVAVGQDGQAWVLTVEEINTPPDPSKATENIGTLAEMPDPDE